jgi:hypothetical protein
MILINLKEFFWDGMNNMFNLIDNKGNDINIEDIIRYKNLETKKVIYYFVGDKMMYRYNEQGLFKHDSFDNIKVGNGVTLVNKAASIWTRLSTKGEVYDEIFG